MLIMLTIVWRAREDCPLGAGNRAELEVRVSTEQEMTP